ncbi:Survival factor 1 [Spathaspora sp. JA1]|nr:Survival factor 1 [Spathaspora sp. JA1]
MLKWVQSGLSAVAGTAEPEYGADAIQPITKRITNNQISRSTTEADFNWLNPGSTTVETKTFYFTDLKSGSTGFAQIIHSSVMGVHTTAQFTFRLYNSKTPEIGIWTSTKLENFRLEGPNFFADGISLELVDNKTFNLKFTTNPDSLVELSMTRLTDGVIFGDDGFTFYGEDPEQPWGSMRHAFWPRCSVVGKISTPTATDVEIDGYTMFVFAMQGMKPHHAAKAWNFLNYQSENYAAVQMEFTTPKSYAETRVNVGMICTNEKVLYATINNKVVHLDPHDDVEIGWPVPKSIEFHFLAGVTTPDEEGEEVGLVKGDLKTLVERVDVMAEIPQLVKTIVSNVAGAKPYIYQYCDELELTIDGKTETGVSYSEVTFISE